MRWFLDSIDAPANLQRGINAVRGTTGLPAFLFALALSVICIGLMALIWFFDISSTLDYTTTVTTLLIPTLPAQAMGAVALVSLSLTVLPSFVELFTSRFALVGVKAAAWLIYAFSLFDAITDYPRVAQFWDAFRPGFAGLGWAAEPVMFVLGIGTLYLASFGFETLFCVFAGCTLALFLNAFSGTKQGVHRDRTA